MKSIIEQIHQEFYTASDKIADIAIPAKAKVLHSLGFTSSSDVPVKMELRELIFHYRKRYPNNKFITDEEVQRICVKYNLICGPVSSYKGSVPDEKVVQIAKFSLRAEDKRKDRYIYSIKYYSRSSYDLGIPKSAYDQLPASIESDVELKNASAVDREVSKRFSHLDIHSGIRLVERAVETHITYDSLFICAPPNEMGTENMTKKGVFAFLKKERAMIEDPVVLQPVGGGYLILAAWGPEASDEDVVNHQMN